MRVALFCLDLAGGAVSLGVTIWAIYLSRYPPQTLDGQTRFIFGIGLAGLVMFLLIVARLIVAYCRDKAQDAADAGHHSLQRRIDANQRAYLAANTSELAAAVNDRIYPVWKRYRDTLEDSLRGGNAALSRDKKAELWLVLTDSENDKNSNLSREASDIFYKEFLLRVGNIAEKHTIYGVDVALLRKDLDDATTYAALKRIVNTLFRLSALVGQR